MTSSLLFIKFPETLWLAEEKSTIDLLIHDLKNPLAVVQAGLSGLLSRQGQYGPLTPKQEKVLTRLLRNTRGAQMLVYDALEMEGDLSLSSGDGRGRGSSFGC